MSTKIKILVAAVVAAGIAFLIWRRRAQAAQIEGLTAATPSTTTAITALQTGVQQLPGLATAAALEKVQKILPPVIGQGLQAVIPQNTPKPPTGNPCPDPSYVGPSPVSSSTWCGGTLNCPPEGGGMVCAIQRGLRAQGLIH